jgi:hypothetical protein
MKLEDNINETIIRVCDEFASGIEKYDNIPGGILPPEHLLASHALMELGDVLTMTAETNGGTLWQWNANRRGHSQSSPPPGYQFSGRRVDLLIFKGDHTKKSEMGFLCLVEFNSDRLIRTISPN